jgi:hypothetical protein
MLMIKRLRGGIELAVTATDIFDRNPPFVNNPSGPVGYDLFNANLDRRVVGVTLRKTWCRKRLRESLNRGRLTRVRGYSHAEV